MPDNDPSRAVVRPQESQLLRREAVALTSSLQLEREQISSLRKEKEELEEGVVRLRTRVQQEEDHVNEVEELGTDEE
jgi:predicted nuclease with TOPRIM domain